MAQSPVNNNLAMLAARPTAAPLTYDTVDKLAQTIFKSNLYPMQLKTANAEETLAKITVILLTAVELNLPPMQAVNAINVIRGKIAVSPAMMLALCYRTRELTNLEIVDTDEGCTVTMTRAGVKTPYTFSFTAADAQKMGILGNDNYKKQPRVMYKWRAVSGCTRVLFSDAVLGLYTQDELGAKVQYTESGDVVEGSFSVEDNEPSQVKTTEAPPAPPQLVPKTPPAAAPQPAAPVEAQKPVNPPPEVSKPAQNGSEAPAHTREEFRSIMAALGYNTPGEIGTVMAQLGFVNGYSPELHDVMVAGVTNLVKQRRDAADLDDEDLAGLDFGNDESSFELAPMNS